MSISPPFTTFAPMDAGIRDMGSYKHVFTEKKVCTQVKSGNDKKNLNMYAGFISINFNLKHKMGIIEW